MPIMKGFDASPMSRMILVRHAQPEIDPTRPAADWHLSEVGRHAAHELALVIGRFAPDRIVTSPEQRARETGAEIANVLGLAVATDDDLREQGFGPLPYLGDDAFRHAVRAHFLRPDEIVLGQESARDAGVRLAGAIDHAHQGSPETLNPSIVVTHGRILASFLSQLTGMDAIAIWESLRMPDALLVDLERGTFRAIH